MQSVANQRLLALSNNQITIEIDGKSIKKSAKEAKLLGLVIWRKPFMDKKRVKRYLSHRCPQACKNIQCSSSKHSSPNLPSVDFTPLWLWLKFVMNLMLFWAINCTNSKTGPLRVMPVPLMKQVPVSSKMDFTVTNFQLVETSLRRAIPVDVSKQLKNWLSPE